MEKIDHIAITVPNITRAVKWYTSNFDCKAKYKDRTWAILEFDNINLAISSLYEYGIQTIKKSSFYETFSHPNKKDPKFINIVISVKTHLQPIDLMSVLISIEESLNLSKFSAKNKS